MTIIETDGVATNPLTVDSLQIFVGQRYSIIVEANQTVDNYCELLFSHLLSLSDRQTGIRAIPSPLVSGSDNSNIYYHF
jgi:FtsP/CotA-like multicopper oxidase with cupredoxin domain